MDGPVLDNPVSDEMMMFINGMFLACSEAFGFVTAFGLWTQKALGIHSEPWSSALATIVFDVWAIVAVQSSAAMGIGAASAVHRLPARYPSGTLPEEGRK
ncbi:MAG: hypothetical protein MZV70_43850 [Desulfobacterales bacterium]|nr:hypothetical protein [Desulfobacterales bacterium]